MHVLWVCRNSFPYIRAVSNVNGKYQAASDKVKASSVHQSPQRSSFALSRERLVAISHLGPIPEKLLLPPSEHIMWRYPPRQQVEDKDNNLTWGSMFGNYLSVCSEGNLLYGLCVVSLSKAGMLRKALFTLAKAQEPPWHTLHNMTQLFNVFHHILAL